LAMLRTRLSLVARGIFESFDVAIGRSAHDSYD
jgi:hypothetical protein